jgi:hypothetical protein
VDDTTDDEEAEEGIAAPVGCVNGSGSGEEKGSLSYTDDVDDDEDDDEDDDDGCARGGVTHK